MFIIFSYSPIRYKQYKLDRTDQWRHKQYVNIWRLTWEIKKSYIFMVVQVTDEGGRDYEFPECFLALLWACIEHFRPFLEKSLNNKSSHCATTCRYIILK